jgi:hypothetical protein
VVSAVAQAAVMFPRHSIEAATMVISSALIFQTRVTGITPIVIVFAPAVTEVTAVMMELTPAVAKVSAVLMAKFAVVFGAPIMLLTAFLIGFSGDRKRWNHQGAGNQSRQNKSR